MAESGYGMMKKLVYAEWVGDQVKHVHRANARQLFPSIKSFVHNNAQISGRPVHIRSSSMPVINQ